MRKAKRKLHRIHLTSRASPQPQIPRSGLRTGQGPVPPVPGAQPSPDFVCVGVLDHPIQPSLIRSSRTLFLALAFFPSLAFLCFAAVLGATLLLTAAFWFLVISGLAVMIFLVVLTGCLIIASTVSLWGAALWLTYRYASQLDIYEDEKADPAD